jgi:CCR4-NOT transcriptional complex subunit CAF120
MIFQQPAIETTRDTEPELIPIFQYLSSHANKLYQEGYFLKLNDLDTSRSFSEEVKC